MSGLPSHARVAIVGGGVVGCSVAYHLAKAGWSDVVLLEQGTLSCGTTWHAAGLVGQLRAQESMTRLIRYSTRLYAELEAETGLATGWNNCGSMTIARTPERMTQLKRTAAVARAYGVACDVIPASDAAARWPLMRSDDIVGGVWLPGDGKANPTDLTQALAKGARNRGAQLHEGTRVIGIETRDSRVRGLRWQAKSGDQGTLDTDVVVNCAGQWAKAIGRMCGVTIPMHSAEHYYVVTGAIQDIPRDLPVLRDPDGYIYFKEEVGGLVMGGFEPDATPWGMNGIPHPFEFQLLPDNWDAFEILMENAMHRVPAMQAASIRQFVNGPESFTPDNNFILGEAPGLRGFFVGAGFNSMGIASAGGAGMALADWIVAGEPTMDLWPVDIRRFARFNDNDRWLHDRVRETLGLHYMMPWPNRELESARPFRRSPLYAHLERAGARFGSKMGWERPNFFAPASFAKPIDYTFGRPDWLQWSGAEHRACREGVALFDMSSFAKLLVKGRDAAAVLQTMVANDVDVRDGKTVYTGMLNERGGYESDFTLTRLARDEYLVVTGSAQATRDLDWIERHIPDDMRCIAIDVTAMYSVVAVMGPRSRDLLQTVSSADWSDAAFPFGTSRDVDIGYANVRATRLTYVGELGWELYVPVEFAVGVYETLRNADGAFAVADAGYYAIDSLRIERGYRAWGRELSPERNPFEAGLQFACKLSSGVPFRGRDALLRISEEGVRRCIAVLTIDASDLAEAGDANEASTASAATRPSRATNTPSATGPMLWGGEAILRDGKPAGFVTSAAFGHTLGKPVALGIVEHHALTRDLNDIIAGRFEIDLAGIRLPATVSLRAPYDPKNLRIR